MEAENITRAQSHYTHLLLQHVREKSFERVREKQECEHSFSVVNLLRGQTSANITERSPLLRFPQDDSLTYMTVHDPGFADEHWDQTLDFERRFRLGSEVTSLSLSRSCSSGDKNENLDRNFKFAHNIRCCMKVSKTVCIFTLVVLCSLFFSMYPDRDNPWRMLAVSPTESFSMNLTDFRDNALLKLQVAGPFSRNMMMDLTNQDYLLIQVEQSDEPGLRRRRAQQRPSLVTVVEWIDYETLALLFGMMILVAIFSETGFFDYCAVKVRHMSITRHLSSSRRMHLSLFSPLLVFGVSSLSSSQFVSPLLFYSSRRYHLSRRTCVWPMIMILMFNQLPFSLHPPNTMRIRPAAAFMRHLSVCFCLFSNLPHGLITVTHKISDKVLLVKCVSVLSVVIFMFFLNSFVPSIHLDLGWIAVLGALWLLVLADIQDFEIILHRVEWATLLFFAGLFVLMEALAQLQLIDYIGEQTALLIKSVPEDQRLAVAIILVMWVSALASSLIDNIPFTATMIPVLINLSQDADVDLPVKPLIFALAMGACLGGNGTLIGASANVVCAGIAEQHGYGFSFMEFFK
ncbi:hypothetical protein WMY93_031691 [Mugilogobius chulae]|uniref:Citrate transporter-like domain-containing protein n=1 Tax=Mugilogobius chulae TaxID=88201 RepID=A0AAW0MH18_9GOBI